MVVTQIIGIVAAFFSVMSFQQKTQKKIVAMQLIASSFWTLHFFRLGAYTGCFLNLIAATRDVVFHRREKKWAASPIWIYVVGIASAGVCLLSFTLFDVEFSFERLVIELLPVLGMIASTIAMRLKEASKVRLFSFISSPLWLIYNIINASLGGIVTESISIISIIIGILRLDIKRKSK